MKKILILLFTVITVLQVKATIYYIDATGGSTSSDTYDGTEQTHTVGVTGPWATLTKVNSFFSSLNPGDQVLFKKGQTWTGTITVNTSGSSGNPIIISTWGSGANPIITGLLPLTWTSSGTNLWHSNASLTSSMVMCVTKNNLVTPMGRWPDPSASGTDFGLGKGWATISAVTIGTTSTITETNSEITGHPSTGSMIGSWVFFKGARYWIETWNISAFTVSGSPSIRKISFPTITNGVSDPSVNWGYSIENNPETLTYQDAWYFDPVNNWILMYSIGSPSNISASNSTNLLKSNGFSSITVDGLEFNGSNEDAINVIGGNNFIVQNCNIHNVGRNGVKSDDQNTSVLNNTITDCQSKGVTFLANGGGISSGNPTVVQGNTITNMGQYEGMGNGSQETESPWSSPPWTTSNSDANHSGVGVYIEQDNTDNILVQLNTITNCGYAGVAIKRSSNLTIVKNVISTFCNITDDGGGVYSVLNSNILYTARVISNNIISNAIGASRGRTSPNTALSGNAGIYNDNATNGATEQGNSIFNCGKGIFCNNGTDHLDITNNTIYNCSFGMQVNTGTSLSTYDHRSRSLIFTGNLIFVKNLKTGNTTSNNPAEYAFLVHTDGVDDPDSITNVGGTINSNKYLKSVSTSLLMLIQNTGDSIKSLAQWQSRFTAVNFDATSTTSVAPWTYTDTTLQNNNTLFIYNATNSSSIRSLPFQCSDDYGSSFNSGTITLAAFTSKILHKTGNLVNTGDSKLIINGKLIIIYK